MDKNTKTTFYSKDLLLEGYLHFPSEESGIVPGVVLCHPHPLLGGDMNNDLLLSVCRAIVSNNMAVLRFNFRGVGESEGGYAQGLGEQEDAMAALSFLSQKEEIESRSVGIMGYSFGGMVALSVGSRDETVKAMAAVSPVVPTGLSLECKKPKMILCGTEDNMTSSSMILQEATQMAEPKDIEVVSGADHFWHGYEEKAASRVADFFKKYLTS